LKNNQVAHKSETRIETYTYFSQLLIHTQKLDKETNDSWKFQQAK